MTVRLNHLLYRLRRLAARSGPDPDATLLNRFVSERDPLAFEALVRRHGPLVLGVCRRLLGDSPDAEDAFQATFLVLARRASSIRATSPLAAWLYGVASRVALGARSAAARRRRHEALDEHLSPTDGQPDPLSQLSARELLAALEEEIRRLPEVYRLPVVLCCLDGLTLEEAAQHLSWTPGSVKGRLERGRARLHARLVRRGLALPACLAAAEVVRGAGLVVPISWITAARTALQAAPAGATQLAQVALPGLLLTRFKIATALALGLLAVAAGAGVYSAVVRGRPAGPGPATGELPQAAGPIAPVREEGTDVLADPLPAKAVARLGTVRFRQEDWTWDLGVSPDGKTLGAVAGSTLALWDRTTGRPVRRVTFERNVHSLAFAPDGKVVAVGGEDCIVRLVDLSSGKEIRRLVGHRTGEDRFDSSVGAAFLSGNTILTWGSDRTIREWDIRSGKELRKLAAGNDYHRAHSPDGKVLAVAVKESPGKLRLWDVKTDREIHTLDHPADTGAAVFSPDGKTLAVAWGGEADKPGRITLWNVGAGKEIGRLEGHKSWVFALAFAPDGKTLASGGYDRTLRLWDPVTGKEQRRAEGFRTSVSRLVFSQDGRTLFVGGPENRVRPWDVASWKEHPTFDGPEWGIFSLVYSPNGQFVAAPSSRTIWMWDATNGKLVRKLEGHTGTVTAVAFSADGKTLVSGADDGLVCLWDASTGREQRRLAPAGGPIRRVALSPDGKLVAWAENAPTTLFLWPTGTDRAPRKLTVSSESGARPTLASLAFTPDGKTLYAGSGTHLGLLRWDVVTGKELPSLGRHDGGVNGVVLAPDGRSLAVVTMGGTLYLWETATEQTRMVVKDLGYATSVAFSPDGRWLALANNGRHYTSREGTREGGRNREEVRLVNALNGKVVARFTGHFGGVGCLAFSPDGRRLASGGEDTTILIWEIPSEGDREATPAPALRLEQRAALWLGLAQDAAEAHRHMARLIEAPEQAVVLLGERLRPIKAIDPDRLTPWIRALASEDFRLREEANRVLTNMGEEAEPGLRKALRGDPPFEARRRIERILNSLVKSARGEGGRTERALEVLERIGDRTARNLLRRLAEGAPEAWLTELAREGLRRVEAREKLRP
jgi:RNA polymerase sigma factor (sigma-70 family)